MKIFNNDKRKSERIKLRGLRADTASENKFFYGNVREVSQDGFKITNLSNQFDFQQKQYTIFISGYEKGFLITIQPCWHKKDPNGNDQEIGFRIVQSPNAWTNFIHNMISTEKRYRKWLQTGVVLFS